MFSKYINEKSVISLLLLFFATAGWVYVKLQETYSTNQQLPLVIENLPEDKIPLVPIPQNLDVSIEGSGTELLIQLLGLKKKSINLDFNQFTSQNIITAEDLKSEINSENAKYNIKKIIPDTLFVEMDNGTEKTLPIRLISKIETQEGFAVSGRIEYTPDSIKVYGPKKIVDTLRFLDTEKLVLKDLSTSQKGKMGLSKENKSIHFDLSEINYNIPIEQLTEIRFSGKSIEFLNVENEEFIYLSPNSCTISFNVPVSKIDEVSAESFRVVADFESVIASGEHSKVPLKLAKFPSYASSVRINPNIVDFVFKKDAND